VNVASREMKQWLKPANVIALISALTGFVTAIAAIREAGQARFEQRNYMEFVEDNYELK
jgi:hypothetical protein